MQGQFTDLLCCLYSEDPFRKTPPPAHFHNIVEGLFAPCSHNSGAVFWEKVTYFLILLLHVQINLSVLVLASCIKKH